MKKVGKLPLICAVLLMLPVLAACAPAGGGDTPPEPAIETITLAALEPKAIPKALIQQFNQNHSDIQIEVKDYSVFDQDALDGRHGLTRLLSEILAGKIPDIIATSSGQNIPYNQLAQRGYLEDLWPYIENDPDLGRDSIVEAPLKAAEVDGHLYMIFDSFCINTLVGAENIVGERTSWKLSDLQSAFAAMPPDSSVLEFSVEKSNLFPLFLSLTLDSYVDWETGQCHFDSDSLRSALEFVNSFPDATSVEIGDDVTKENAVRIQEGRQLLWSCFLNDFYSVQFYDAQFASIYGENSRAAFIGFPVEDGNSGSDFRILGTKYVMSSTCKKKDAAWEFIRQTLLPKYDEEKIGRNHQLYNKFPVNRTDYELIKKYALTKKEGLGSRHLYGGIMLRMRPVTDEEVERLEKLINSICRIDIWDTTINDIVWEQCAPYFAGDRTLDETIAQIQSRVSLYVNEQM